MTKLIVGFVLGVLFVGAAMVDGAGSLDECRAENPGYDCDLKTSWVKGNPW